MDNQPTNQDILQAINGLSSTVDGLSSKFDGLSSAVKQNTDDIKDLNSTVQEVLEVMNEFSSRTDERFKNIESTINTQLVTKDYLDQKIAEVRDDLVVPIKKVDKKLVTLVNKIGNNKILPASDIQEVLAMEVLSKTA